MVVVTAVAPIVVVVVGPGVVTVAELVDVVDLGGVVVVRVVVVGGKVPPAK